METFYKYFKPTQKYQLVPVYEHLRSHFEIFTKILKNYFERFDTEAYFIKTWRLSFNIQTDDNRFALQSKKALKINLESPLKFSQFCFAVISRLSEVQVYQTITKISPIRLSYP